MYHFISESTRSLYIHWPFCPYKCSFCPFVALAGHDQFMERYHNALVKEIETFAKQYDQKLVLDTIYFGGGTPSTYPDALLLDMFGILKKVFVFSPDIEITFEVNPGTVRAEQLVLWRQLGINRISVGVQSLKDPVLHKLNRLQSAADVSQLLENAKGIIDNVSIDLILGLPEVAEDEWKDMIQKIVTWPIQHMSMYFLMVHEDTPLYFKVKRNQVALPCDDNVVDLYLWSIAQLKEHGFEQYEVSNFARSGFQSRHNKVYWDRKPYKAFGLGACSFDGSRRFQNEKNLMNYMNSIENDKEVAACVEQLLPQQVRLEKIMLGLRRSAGIAFQEMCYDLTLDEQIQLEQRVAWLKEHKFIQEKDGVLVLTPSALALENEIVLKLSL